MPMLKIRSNFNQTVQEDELHLNSLYILFSDIDNIGRLLFNTDEKGTCFVHTAGPESIKLQPYIKKHKVSKKQMERLLLESFDLNISDINDAELGCQLTYVLANLLPDNDILIAGLAGLAPKSIAFTAALCNKLLITTTNKLIILLLQPGYDISHNVNGKYIFHKIEHGQLHDIDKWLTDIERSLH